jgi:hypothetical protein
MQLTTLSPFYYFAVYLQPGKVLRMIAFYISSLRFILRADHGLNKNDSKVPLLRTPFLAGVTVYDMEALLD